MLDRTYLGADGEDSECDFSTLLGNKDVYKELDELQKNEIKLLEQMESYLSKKLHIDQEYTEKLSKLHQKFPADSLVFLTEGSQVNKAWKVFVEDSKNKAETLLNSSKTITQTILPSIKALTVRKKHTLASFVSRANDLKRDLRSFDDEVKRLEGTYKENLKDVLKSRKKMDELYIKTKGGREYTKYKEHLGNASLKLHMNHNDYVLAVLAYNEYEKFYKNTLVKAYLKMVQDVQEKYVEPWKEIYSGMLSNTAWCTEENITSEDTVKVDIDKIDLRSEYKSFVEEHGKPAGLLIPYLFEPTLSEDSQQTGLNADTLAFNDLTHTPLNIKKRSYEEEDKEFGEKIQKMQLNYEKETISLNEMMERGTKNAQLSIIDQYITCMELKGQLSDMECKKSVCQTQLDLLTTTLALAAQGVPSYEISGSTLEQPPPPVAAKNKSKTLDAKSRHAVTASNSAPSPSLQHGNALGSLFHKKAPPVKPDKSAKPKPRGVSDPLPYCGPSEAMVPNLTNLTLSDTLVENSTNQVPPTDLELCAWYHGKIDRKKVAMNLQRNGDFLVREKQDGSGVNVLSLYWNGAVRHFILNPEDGYYKLEGEGFVDIPSLINYHYMNSVVVTSTSGAMLCTPIGNSEEFLHSDIVLRLKLGSGNFGDVFQGELVYNKEQVAVKTCKENTDDRTKKKFLNEAGIMRPCDHPNVLRLIGVSKDIEPYYIILELCVKGDLVNVLQREGVRLSNIDLYKFAVDAATGMEYLESMQIIHRDLAARNCLVTAEYVVKISDFGMSREEDQEGFYSMVETKIIPIRWSAPEIWNTKVYSAKSDVWSYGVLLWEIFSRGSVPYTGWDNKTTSTQIDNGYRLPPPNGMPPQIGQVMEDCWHTDPRNRSSFYDIVQSMTRMSSSIW